MFGFKSKILLPAFLAVACMLLFGCAIPRHIWKQDDIRPVTLNEGAPGEGILIASGRSDFKQAVIERLRRRFEPQGIYMKVVGLSGLADERSDAYGAVVIMNSCVAWGMDPRVDGFLKRNEANANVVVLATSRNGTWLPDFKGGGYDAVSSASKGSRVSEVANRIGERVEALLSDR